jgi:maltooligosyltrehalose trehalohydrolase
MKWQVRWSSEDPGYGGFGTPSIEGDESWHSPDESATVIRAVRDSEMDA